MLVAGDLQWQAPGCLVHFRTLGPVHIAYKNDKITAQTLMEDRIRHLSLQQTKCKRHQAVTFLAQGKNRQVRKCHFRKCKVPEQSQHPLGPVHLKNCSTAVFTIILHLKTCKKTVHLFSLKQRWDKPSDSEQQSHHAIKFILRRTWQAKQCKLGAQQ